MIEGPLPLKQCHGWIHNMVPILTTKELRHNLEGCDRFTALNCRNSFFHFLLDEESQELFKFHAKDGIYHFLMLVMGTSRILDGLKGVIVIKDDILVHGKGEEHDAILDACLQRLYKYGIRLI